LLRQQGVAFDGGGEPLNGAYTLSFRLYDAASGGTQLWEEVQVGLQVDGGLFDITLGQKVPVSPDLFTDNDSVFLELQIEGEPPLPRTQVTSTPYALASATADIATHLECSGCVVAEDIDDGAITAAKLGEPCQVGEVLKMTSTGWACAPDNAGGTGGLISVGSDDITSGAVTSVHIDDGAIGTSELDDGAVTAAKLGINCPNGQILKRELVGAQVVWNCAEDAVNEGTVTSVAAGAGLIGGTITGSGTLALAPQGVTSDHLATGAVTMTKIAAEAVTAVALADFAVTSDKIANSAITTTKIAAGAVTGAKLASGSVGTSHLGFNSVNTSRIAPNAIDNQRLQNNAVSGSKIAGGAVTASHLATETITGNKIADKTITKDKLAPDVGIDCNWDGERYVSHGIDGGCAFLRGMNITCSGGKVIKMSWIQNC